MNTTIQSTLSEESESVSVNSAKTIRRLLSNNFTNLDWLSLVTIISLVACLYYKIFLKLVFDWYTLPDFSHGFLIPFFAVYILWNKKHDLRKLPVRPMWFGILIVLTSMLVLLAGIYGAELFLSRISFIFLIAGLIITFYGWDFLRELKVIILLLVLSIPIPAIIFNQITFPLQLLASQIAAISLQILGVPVLRDGNVIQLATIRLEVAEACSGIRSLMSLFTLSILYGYFIEDRRSHRILLAIASVPIAVAANSVRIIGTGLCVQYWDPDRALGFFHEFSGWVMFIVSLLCLYCLHLAMQFFSRDNEASK